MIATANDAFSLPCSLPSSFRDPAGIVYTVESHIYRQIMQSGLEDYQKLIKSGLYEKLSSLGYLIPHEEVSKDFALNAEARLVLKPQKIPFISYCFEWCFSQLKDAALCTLEIAKLSLEYGMILKDASAYNIQFYQGKPIFIDTCSFTAYKEGQPWVAYKQFCQHFLAPLVLMAKKDIRLGLLAKHYIDGIPLDLANDLLPIKSKLSLSILMHLHMHAKFQQKFAETTQLPKKKQGLSKANLLGLLNNLQSLISQLTWSPSKTEWSHYYDATNYTDNATLHKMTLIKQFAAQVKPWMAWDLGGNNGFYSRAIAEHCRSVLCFDMDFVAVEANYRKTKEENNSVVLPLLQDLVNPSTGMGWAGKERASLRERGPADLIMALALIHHLAISNNLPLKLIAKYFSSLGDYLIIEFVPKEDSQVKRLLANRDDVFHQYDILHFKKAFSSFYTFLEEIQVRETNRTIFLMKKIDNA